GSSAISLESNDCGLSFVAVVRWALVVSVGSVVSEAVVVGPDDDVSSGLTSHQMPSAPRTRTKTPAAAAVGVPGALLPRCGGPGGGGAPGCVCQRTHPNAGLRLARRDLERELVVTDADPVAVGQHRGAANAFATHVDPVGRSQVADHETRTGVDDDGVMAA